VRVRYGCIKVLSGFLVCYSFVRFECIMGFEWFFRPVTLLYSTLFVDNEFPWVISTSECRLGKPNQLNFGVVCE
jgi:hypothetical protein